MAVPGKPLLAVCSLGRSLLDGPLVLLQNFRDGDSLTETCRHATKRTHVDDSQYFSNDSQSEMQASAGFALEIERYNVVLWLSKGSISVGVYL
jgi:hypothetical protein